jgi:hypothetical protein
LEQRPMLIGKSAIMILVAAAMAAPCIANAGSTSSRCGLLKIDAAKVSADNEIIQAAGGMSDSESCASARDMVRINDDMISIITRDPAKCGVPDDRLEAVETSRTRMAARAASCSAKGGLASSQCASLKPDWRAIHANVEIIHEEAGARFAYPGWCGNARNLIRAADHIISVVTHDPAKCRWTSDNLDRIEAWRAKIAPHTEGCP